MGLAEGTPPLFEREAELEALDAALGGATAGSGRLLLVEGEAGSGKSELLAAARRRASDGSIHVLSARGSELEVDVPFGVTLELFGRLLQAAQLPERRALFRGAAELAAPLFSAEAIVAAEAETNAPSSFPVVHGLYWLLVNLTEGSPLLITVDDAHWADTQSLRFLLYLAERLDGLPVALAVALTPEEAPAGGRALARLRAAPRARILQLEPLTKDATADLVRTLYFPDADDQFCRAVFDAGEGNPFLVGEILRAVDLEGLPATAASAARVQQLAPESVVRAAQARISRLPANAASLAQAVAVLGPDAQLRLAARVAGIEIPVAAAAADELVMARLLLPGEPLDFAQRLVCWAVYKSIPAGRRSDLHARAARFLAAEEPHP
ncbi:MAG: AAA family ATPase, partial [Actinobacteria bacterium]|nr:AAA family ATPase [Actinomycetota bacterium]